MDKSTLVAEVAKRADVARGDVAEVLDTAFALIRENVVRGQRVSVSGFGTFERVRRSARVGRNPRTREAVKIPARNVPVFRPGTAFRDAVAAPRRRARNAAARKR